MNIYLIKILIKSNLIILNKKERLNIYQIEHCLFKRTNIFKGKGGVIFIYYEDKNLKLNNCIFYYCCCTEDGGAIYFIGNNVELLKICGSYCFSKFYQFSYLKTNLNNYNNLISINNCFKNTKGFYSYRIDNGNCTLTNFNSSKNFNYRISSIYILDSIFLKNIYCNIIDNFVKSHTIIYFNCYNNNYLSYYNIINNNSPEENGIINFWKGNYTILNSIFLNNKNILIFNEYSNLLIFNCKINHEENYIFKGKKIINNVNINNNLINTIFIIHYSTIYCNANYLLNTFIKFKRFNFNYLIIFLIIILLFKFKKI